MGACSSSKLPGHRVRGGGTVQSTSEVGRNGRRECDEIAPTSWRQRAAGGGRRKRPAPPCRDGRRDRPASARRATLELQPEARERLVARALAPQPRLVERQRLAAELY